MAAKKSKTKRRKPNPGEPTVLWKVLVALMESDKLRDEEIAEVVVQAIGSSWEKCETLPPGLAQATHAVWNNKGRSVLSEVPKEPEVVQLWRRIIEMRDDLVRNISRFESANNPERQYLEYVDFVSTMRRGYPSPNGVLAGEGEGHLRRVDEEAAATACKLRKQLQAIDVALSVGTRDDANERGISIQKLRDLVEIDQLKREKKAKETLQKWWSDRGNKDKRVVAQLSLYRAINRTRATPADFSLLPDLDALRKEDLEYRRTMQGVPSGSAIKSCERVLARALEGGRTKMYTLSPALIADLALAGLGTKSGLAMYTFSP